MQDEIELLDLLQLYYDYKDNIDWERGDFVDPPFVWEVIGELEVGGYIFMVDANLIDGCGVYEREIYVTTPSGKTHQLL